MNNRHSDHISIPSIQQTEFVIPNKADFLPCERFLVEQSLIVLPNERQLVPKRRDFIPIERQLVKQCLYFIPNERQLVPKRRDFIPIERRLVKQCLYFIPNERQLVPNRRHFMYSSFRPEPHYGAFTSSWNQTHPPENQTNT